MKTRTRTANGNGGGKWCRPSTRLAIYLRDRFQCVYCLRDLHGADPRDVTLDHVVTGHADHRPANLVTACRSCNSRRQDTPLTRFAGPETVADVRRRCALSLTPFRTLSLAIIAGELETDAALEARG